MNGKDFVALLFRKCPRLMEKGEKCLKSVEEEEEEEEEKRRQRRKRRKRKKKKKKTIGREGQPRATKY
ncbi:hypothetical protein E2C01_082822 [Portunus trituberculatus]|uniref:Uncharacterized protein n=1 Tax=Portunus trituberculatus TaxID=210409 RepID=A0A5B7J040_PORTR|nr:hypothetical protein [Portunus trituberculatus]